MELLVWVFQMNRKKKWETYLETFLDFRYLDQIKRTCRTVGMTAIQFNNEDSLL